MYAPFERTGGLRADAWGTFRQEVASSAVGVVGIRDSPGRGSGREGLLPMAATSEAAQQAGQPGLQSAADPATGLAAGLITGLAARLTTGIAAPVATNRAGRIAAFALAQAVATTAEDATGNAWAAWPTTAVQTSQQGDRRQGQ